MTRKINELTIPTDGLVLDLPLDGNTNARVGNNGTATNVTWVWADRWYVSEVGSFNGTNSYVNTNLNWTFSDYSISLWTKIESPLNKWGLVWAYNSTWWIDRIQLEVLDPTNIQIRDQRSWATTSQVVSDSAVSLDEWVHIVITAEQNWLLKMYINNVLQSSTASIPNDSLDLWSVDIVINWLNINWSVSDFALCDIWLVRVYNKTLTSREGNTLYLEWLRRLWPASAQIWRSVNNDFPLYTPASLPTPIFEISKPQSWGLYYDQSWNGNNGTATNVTDSTNGKYNVMGFNGSSSEIDLPLNADLQPASWKTISISCIIKTTQTPSVYWVIWNWGYQNWISSNSSWFLVIQNNWTLRLTWNWTDVIDSTISVNDWKYHLINVIIRSTNAQFYIDWVLRWSWNITLNAWTSTRSPWLWALHDDNLFYFNWEILNFINYNKALSEKEILQDYYSSFIPN